MLLTLLWSTKGSAASWKTDCVAWHSTHLWVAASRAGVGGAFHKFPNTAIGNVNSVSSQGVIIGYWAFNEPRKENDVSAFFLGPPVAGRQAQHMQSWTFSSHSSREWRASPEMLDRNKRLVWLELPKQRTSSCLECCHDDTIVLFFKSLPKNFREQTLMMQLFICNPELQGYISTPPIRLCEGDQTSHFSADLWQSCVTVPSAWLALTTMPWISR